MMAPQDAPADKIRVMKGHIIEFERRLFLIFTYFHYAVYTVDKASQPADKSTQPNEAGLANDAMN